LREMCEGSGLTAHINYNDVPRFSMLDEYLEQDCVPGGTHRNWESFGDKIELIDIEQKKLLCDPQTSGGLLIAVDPSSVDEVEALLQSNHIEAKSLGELRKQSDKIIYVD